MIDEWQKHLHNSDKPGEFADRAQRRAEQLQKDIDAQSRFLLQAVQRTKRPFWQKLAIASATGFLIMLLTIAALEGLAVAWLVGLGATGFVAFLVFLFAGVAALITWADP